MNITRKWFDWLLLVVALSGAVFACQTGVERSGLTARYALLTSMTGNFPIADASKVYLRALDTGDSLHFAWRSLFPTKL